MSSKLTALTGIVTPTVADLLYIVDPSLGVAGSKSITIANLRTFLLGSVPQRLFVDTTDHAFVAPGPTTFITVPVPANSLRQVGDFLDFVAEFTLQGVGNSKTITYAFGGQNLNAAPWNNTLASVQIVLIGRVYRLTSTTCRCYVAASLPFLGQSNPFTQFGDITVANMDSNSLNFVVSVAAVANDDVVQKVAHMYLTNS